jgi:hypothetical protein
MSAMKPGWLPLIALPLVALSLIVDGCAGPTNVQEQEGSPTNPFSSRMEDEEGTIVEWNGYTQGHQSGKASTVGLELYNGSQDTWPGSFCIQLLDRHSVVATLTQERFSLQPGESWSRQVPVRFPDALAEGAYGLALIIPGRLSNVTTIQVGKGSDSYGGPWPEPVCQ